MLDEKDHDTIEALICPGVVAAGETETETEELIKEAIEFHLDGLKEEKLPIPEPTTHARSVEVAVSKHSSSLQPSPSLLFPP